MYTVKDLKLEGFTNWKKVKGGNYILKIDGIIMGRIYVFRNYYYVSSRISSLYGKTAKIDKSTLVNNLIPISELHPIWESLMETTLEEFQKRIFKSP